MRRLAGVALVLGAIVVPSLSARADTQDVEIQDTQYVPATLTIAAGDTVRWTVVGDSSHSVTSDDGSFDSNPTCIAGVNCMSKVDHPYPHTFNSPGTFTYHCRVQAMTGSIIVRSATTTTPAPTSTTTSTTVAPNATSGSDASASLGSDQPTAVTQGSLPSLPSASRGALPKSIIRTRHEDDLRPYVLADVAIAGTTIIAGIVLVRRGRVPFG